MKTKVYRNNEYILTADFIRLGLEDKDIIEEILQNTSFVTFNRDNYTQMLQNSEYFLIAMIDESGSLLASTAIELNYNMRYYPITNEMLNRKDLTKDYFKNCILKSKFVSHIGAGYVPYSIRKRNYVAIVVDFLITKFINSQYCVLLTSDSANFINPKEELIHCEKMFEKRGFKKRGIYNTLYGPLYFTDNNSVNPVYEFKEE